MVFICIRFEYHMVFVRSEHIVLLLFSVVEFINTIIAIINRKLLLYQTDFEMNKSIIFMTLQIHDSM